MIPQDSDVKVTVSCYLFFFCEYLNYHPKETDFKACTLGTASYCHAGLSCFVFGSVSRFFLVSCRVLVYIFV